MKSTIITLSLSICSFTASAQTLSLEQCRQKAVESNKSISTAKLQVEQMGYDINTYKTNFYPRISLIATDFYSTGSANFNTPNLKLPTYVFDPTTMSYKPNAFQAPDGSTVWNEYTDVPSQSIEAKIMNVFLGGISIEQPIYTGGKMTTAYNMSKIGQQIATSNVRLSESEVIVKTDEAYAMAVKALEMGKVARKYKDLLDELYKNVESAVRHGMKTRNDLMKVQVKKNEVDLQIQRADNAYRLARMNLCHVLGMPVTSPIDVDPSTVEAIQHTLTIDMGDISVDHRPEVEMLGHKVALAEQQVKLIKSDYMPSVIAYGGYAYANGLEMAGRNVLNNGAFSVGVGVKVPLVNFGESTSKVRSAKVKHQMAVLEQEDKQSLMQLEATQASTTLSESIMEIDITHKSLQQAEENMKMSRQQYEVGYEPLSDYLEAQSLWQQAYASHVDARCQLIVAYSKYLKAIGRLR